MKTFFEAHIWPLKSKLYRMAFFWLKDRDEANDAVQEVLEKAWIRRDELQKMDNHVGWMVRALKNQSIQHFRSGRKIESLGDQDYAEPESVEVDSGDAYRRVFSFLEKLPEKQREVFVLREVEGLTYEEIAEYLEISMEQVKVNIFRARKILREYLLNQVTHGRKN
ncbi:MAG TPA: RNA polymerase sigma factor [Anditalea sp.]|nr:RNA polymerase sigma factor [Anditalea sp.]